MHPTARCLAQNGFPSFWRRSMDEFKRLSISAINLDSLKPLDKPVLLWEFSNPSSVDSCVQMADEDIGGFSHAKLTHVPAAPPEPAHALFTGSISNKLPKDRKKVERTGYAAFRTRDRPGTIFGRSLWDTEHYAYLAMRIKSDGRKYKVNIQTESIEYTDIHQHRLFARRPGEWETIVIRWEDFVRTNHGHIVEPQSDMMRSKVRTIGVGLTDRLTGPFQFCISKIWITNNLTDEDIRESGMGREASLPSDISSAHEAERIEAKT